MNRIFLIQLATSFLAGGSAIALLTFIAERVHSRIAGIIVSFPLSMVIAFFFVGWTLSPQAVADIVPIIPLSIGATLIFVVVYVYAALLPLSKPIAIVLSFVSATLVWLILATPLAMLQFTNIPLSLLGYIVLAGMAFYFLTVRPAIRESTSTMQYTLVQNIGRSVFVGCIMMLIVFLSKTMGAFWGGIFSVFPAAYSSTLLILHKQYDAHFLFRTCKMMPLGTLPMLVYAFAARLAFPLWGFVWGTVISYATAAVFFLFMLMLIHKVHLSRQSDMFSS